MQFKLHQSFYGIFAMPNLAVKQNKMPFDRIKITCNKLPVAFGASTLLPRYRLFMLIDVNFPFAGFSPLLPSPE